MYFDFEPEEEYETFHRNHYTIRGGTKNLPNDLLRSFPVPSGKTPTAGGGSIGILSRMESTHPTVPSPPHANSLMFGTFLNISIAGPGPPWVKSNTYSIDTMIKRRLDKQHP